MRRPLVIEAVWDPDGEVWVATSDDVPGLATEAETLELLHLKLHDLVPELLEVNEVRHMGSAVFEVVTTHQMQQLG